MNEISTTGVVIFWLGLFLIIGFLKYDDWVEKANDKDTANSYTEAIVKGTKWGCIWGLGFIIAAVLGLALLYFAAVTL